MSNIEQVLSELQAQVADRFSPEQCDFYMTAVRCWLPTSGALYWDVVGVGMQRLAIWVTIVNNALVDVRISGTGNVKVTVQPRVQIKKMDLLDDGGTNVRLQLHRGPDWYREYVAREQGTAFGLRAFAQSVARYLTE